uniref:S-adenosylmethionine carrier 1ic/mitochondrial-like n=1 Tax=Rhizophora mucronata TaxID=61149 RepID=A0A2P2LUB6_RHIMU
MIIFFTWSLETFVTSGLRFFRMLHWTILHAVKRGTCF